MLLGAEIIHIVKEQKYDDPKTCNENLVSNSPDGLVIPDNMRLNSSVKCLHKIKVRENVGLVSSMEFFFNTVV